MEHSSSVKPNDAKKYRLVWAAFWLSLVVFVIVAFTNVELAIAPGLVAFVCAVVSLLWPCPVCGKRVGIRSFGLFILGLPGARRCVHCSTLLVRFTS